MVTFKEQAQRFGARYLIGDVTSVDLSERPYKVIVQERDVYRAKTLIIASGATAKLLGLESESKLMGHGVSACATCDGFFFKDNKCWQPAKVGHFETREIRDRERAW